MNEGHALGGFHLPHRVGRYELLYELASGGMATVFLGRAVGAAGFQRIVAVKVCHPHLQRDPEFIDMFLDEARLAARIHHPNVVATLDVGTEGTLHMVMEYVDGCRLLDLVRGAAQQGAYVPVPLLLRVMIDALAGLHAAHETRDPRGAPLNLVHRDVSPHNILLGFDGVTRLVDFGVAKAEARAVVTRSKSTVKGKVPYLAPEQVRGERIDRRVDLFAAGVVLWEALAGRRLFRGETDAETMQRVLHDEVPPPSESNVMVPAELDAIVLAALQKNPEERYATAADFARALEHCGVAPASTREVAEYAQAILAPLYAERCALRERLDAMLVSAPAPKGEPATLTNVPALTVAGRAPRREGVTLSRGMIFGLLGAGATFALVVVGAAGLLLPRERGPAAPPTTIVVNNTPPVLLAAPPPVSLPAPPAALPDAAAQVLAAPPAPPPSPPPVARVQPPPPSVRASPPALRPAAPPPARRPTPSGDDPARRRFLSI